MRILLRVVVAGCICLLGCPNLPGGGGSKLDLSKDDKAQHINEVDMVFLPFDGAYPSGWPAEFKLPAGVMLNHGGKIPPVGIPAGSFGFGGVLHAGDGETLGQLKAVFGNVITNDKETSADPREIHEFTLRNDTIKYAQLLMVAGVGPGSGYTAFRLEMLPHY